MLLEREADLSIYWHGQSYQEALSHIRIGLPDLVIAGLQSEGITAFNLIRDLCHVEPRVQVLVFGSCPRGAYTNNFLSLGACAFVRKSESTEVILTTIRSILTSKMYLSPDQHGQKNTKVLGKINSTSNASLLALADRELEVFQLIGVGKTNPEIARGMKLSVKTVETYKANIKEKLSFRNDVELIQTAYYWVDINKN